MSGAPLHTRIWREEPEADNPFAPRAAYCHGYDVYGQMLGKAGWADMLYLLFKGEAATPRQARTLETLALALANPGPRDPMVHAAMCGGVGGSPAAASLIAALSVGAGQTGGARDVFLCMQQWARCESLPHPDRIAGLARHDRKTMLAPVDAGWPETEHAPGFDPHGVRTASTVRLTLETLAGTSPGQRLPWLAEHRGTLEEAAGLPLAMTGVAAAALADLGLNASQGEMLFLVLRLPGAAVHALEQADYGFKHFPYPPVELLDDPLNNATTAAAQGTST